MNRRSFLKTTLLAVVAVYAPLTLRKPERDRGELTYLDIEEGLNDSVTRMEKRLAAVFKRAYERSMDPAVERYERIEGAKWTEHADGSCSMPIKVIAGDNFRG